jgi:hypothetical protein
VETLMNIKITFDSERLVAARKGAYKRLLTSVYSYVTYEVGLLMGNVGTLIACITILSHPLSIE